MNIIFRKNFFFHIRPPVIKESPHYLKIMGVFLKFMRSLYFIMINFVYDNLQSYLHYPQFLKCQAFSILTSLIGFKNVSGDIYINFPVLVLSLYTLFSLPFTKHSIYPIQLKSNKFSFTPQTPQQIVSPLPTHFLIPQDAQVPSETHETFLHIS